MKKLLDSPWEQSIHPVILIVEDSDEDFYVFLRAAKNTRIFDELPYQLLRFLDGDEALDYLLRQGDYQDFSKPLPTAILLDLNLPGTDGRDVIQQIKQTPTLKQLPIIVLTTSSNVRDIDSCYTYGVNSYLLKPMGIQRMQETVQLLLKYWFDLAVLPSTNVFD